MNYQKNKTVLGCFALSLMAAGFATPSAMADQVIVDDLIVTFSACVGNDCVNGESFGFDGLRLKENNIRIHFDDTSSSASFPQNDWRILINDTSNGGASFFGVEDSTAGRRPFTITAGAPSNSLFVSSVGRLGLGTGTPVVELHVVDGDTPTVRLEQDGSSGFTAQTWDLASNETNFFVRDVSNGSKLPFRIRPGAPTSSIDIAADGKVGMGTGSPQQNLDITKAGPVGIDLNNSSATRWRLRSGGANNLVISTPDDATTIDEFVLDPIGNLTLTGDLVLSKAGPVAVNLNNSAAERWQMRAGNAGNVVLAAPDDATTGSEFALDVAGNLTIAGNFIAQGGTQLNVPDYVFHESYPLMPLKELEAFIAKNRHLPKVPSADEVKAKGSLDMTQMQMRLLEKVEELTLYTIAQQAMIDKLEAKLAQLDKAP